MSSSHRRVAVSIGAAGISALLIQLTERDGIRGHWMEIAATGVIVFIVLTWIERRRQRDAQRFP